MQDAVELIGGSGEAETDARLRGLVAGFVEAFPGRIHSVYLVGSRADGSAVATSDIDLRIVFRGAFQAGELERFLRLRQYVRELSPLGIDCPPLSQERLAGDEDWLHETISIKTASVLLYGEDLRPSLSLPSQAAFTRHVTAAPLLFMRQVRRNPPVLHYPLDYPDADGLFYGYDYLPSDPGGHESSLKLLVHIAGFIATSLLALQAGQMVTSKSGWLPAYRSHIHDEWLPFLEMLYQRGKVEWAYRIPEGEEQREFVRWVLRLVV